MKTRKLFSIASLAAAGIFAATLGAIPASAQVGIGIRIGTPPPPLRYEVRPVAPGPGFVWVDGYYEPYGRSYRWHGGYWQRPPFEGAYYNHPHWDHYPDGWHMHEGYWARGGPGPEYHEDHYWDNHRH